MTKVRKPNAAKEKATTESDDVAVELLEEEVDPRTDPSLAARFAEGPRRRRSPADRADERDHDLPDEPPRGWPRDD